MYGSHTNMPISTNQQISHCPKLEIEMHHTVKTKVHIMSEMLVLLWVECFAKLLLLRLALKPIDRSIDYSTKH